MPEHMPPAPSLLSRDGHQPFFDPLREWESVEAPNASQLPEPPEDQPALPDLETPAAAWQPMSLPAHPPLQFFPSLVLAGVERGQLLCHANDPAGRHLPVWLARLAAGSIRLNAEGETDKTGPVVQETVLAMCADSLPEERLEASIHQLTEQGVRLLTALWPIGPEGKREPTFRPGPLLEQAKARARAELLPLIGEALQMAAPVGRVAWMDGRLRFQHVRGLGPDHSSADDLHLVGIEQRQSRELLHPAGARCRLELKPGQRTPAFVLPGTQGGRDLVSWFVRLWPVPTQDPEAGLVRVEVTRGWWEREGPAGASATSAWMVRLRETDQPTAGPGVVEPVVRLRQSLDQHLDDLPAIARRLQTLWHLP
jgi:hypothetical protein